MGCDRLADGDSAMYTAVIQFVTKRSFGGEVPCEELGWSELLVTRMRGHGKLMEAGLGG